MLNSSECKFGLHGGGIGFGGSSSSSRKKKAAAISQKEVPFALLTSPITASTSSASTGNAPATANSIRAMQKKRVPRNASSNSPTRGEKAARKSENVDKGGTQNSSPFDFHNVAQFSDGGVEYFGSFGGRFYDKHDRRRRRKSSNFEGEVDFFKL